MKKILILAALLLPLAGCIGTWNLQDDCDNRVVYHVHHNGCGHYYWYGQWYDYPQQSCRTQYCYFWHGQWHPYPHPWYCTCGCP